MNLIAQLWGYFKRRKPYMVLEMGAADYIVAMTVHQDKVIVASRGGNIYVLSVDDYAR